ncbi:MAG: FIG005453: Putative DeoR-family transcriptional regulator [uncultured Nocardioidaceae bacterium]|uniref:FIG005453: Putative DeoR-family transcriptional regulator n=1 Tax=uncultured Nocardioidaceae bacterium TaxID=253824 RepID=A0A6J4MJH9_9ACTN|nr:MAG: FIG005453: Putative DeoR-family transcriptional regulator [uncultured Nocardioidaceae bacterium]
MAARKSERLLNLLITLLVSRSYVTKERIRNVVEQYRDAPDSAFEKMFERDKDELRSLGIPIEVGYLDRAFDDEPGYRIERSAFELPEISLEADEAAVLGLAARVWQHAGLASATSDAIVKLKAAGVSVDRTALDVAQPQLAVEEPAFETFWSATQSRTPVTFGYRGAGSAEAAVRHLQPWGVASYRARWYVVGLDTDRGEPRLFRLSRVVGEARLEGEPGSFEVPEDTDLRALTANLAPSAQPQRARLRVRPGSAIGLRRHAAAVRSGAPDWDEVEVDYGRTDALVDELLGYGADVVVDAPDDLRASVVTRLREVAEPVGAPR